MTHLQRILFVEDDADIREVVRLALEDVGGFASHGCPSGEQALHVIDSFSPDLVLLDVMMPDMDGIKTLHALRQQNSVTHIPVVLMTAKVQPRDMKHYHEIGVFDVITKPFDPMNLPDNLLKIWERFHEQ